MINLSELTSPTSVPELVRNMSCVLRHGYFLGRNCEVLNEDPLEDPSKIVKQIESVFYRAIKVPAEYADFVNLEICLDMYDRLLAFNTRDVDMLVIDRPSVFSLLIAKIDKICAITPKKGEDLALELEVHEILHKQNNDRRYLQALLSYLIVNQRFYENVNNHVHLRLHDLYVKQKAHLHYTVLPNEKGTRADILLVAPGHFRDADIDALSELDLGLGLRFASYLDTKSIKGKVQFHSNRLSKDDAKKMIETLKEISQREDLSHVLRDMVTYTIDFAFWRYVSAEGQSYRSGPFKVEYRKSLESYNALFPGERFINRTHWPFENIGLCKKIIQSNAILYKSNLDEDQRDFNDTFFNKYQFVMYRRLLPLYQKIYRTGYEVLFSSTQGMIPKIKRDFLQHQRQHNSINEALLSPNAFEGKVEKSSKEETKPEVTLSKKNVEKKKKQENSLKEGGASSSQELIEENSPPDIQTERLVSQEVEESKKKVLKLDPRIVIWFEDKKAALEDPKYKDLHPHVQEKVTVFHSIGLEVLDLLLEKGVKSQWGERKLSHYSLACEVTIAGHTSKYRGIITVCFNESGSIYHYGFTDKPANLIVSEYMNKRFWDLDFPTLEIAHEKPVKLPEKINPEDGSFFSRVINHHTFELIDNKNKAKVLLFLPETSTN